MNRNAKRPLCLLLALILLCGVLPAPALAATAQAQNAAYELNRLGLFQGSGLLPDGRPDFNLDGTATRAEAVTMLVRLLGGEQEALSRHYTHPFTDAGWAGDYIGYAYQKGIAGGVGYTTFGSNDRITAAQFLTMLLRALGYSQVNWSNPYPTADAVGLAYSGMNDFRRGDMACVCLSSLSCRPNGSSQTLRQQLEAKGAIAASPTSFTPGPVPATAASRYTVTSGEDALAKLVNAIDCRTAQIYLTGPVSLLSECEQAVRQAQALCSDTVGYSMSSSYNSRIMTISVTPTYTDAVEIMAYLEGRRSSLSQANAQTMAKAQQVHAAIVTPQMSEYEQVKAFHDYLVNHTTYGGNSDRIYTAGGALVDGYAVCDGYAMAFDLLCYLSGIECVRVTGYAGESHAWNKVKVNGSWYNVDVTWDDPVSYSPTLIYDYFLVSDAVISRDHVQDSNPFWPAAPANWGGW